MAYLNGAPNYNFNLYRQLVSEITATFNKISQEILGIREKFNHEHNLPIISYIITKIQDEEGQKLENVSIINVLFLYLHIFGPFY